jgi:hypothetical protein
MDGWLGQETSVLREAAKSPLGAIALMIFASSSIAFYFFSEASEAFKLGAFLLLLLAFGMFTLAVSKQASLPSSPIDGNGGLTPNAAAKPDQPGARLGSSPASLFWLAYDIRYAIDAILHDLGRDTVTHHLRQIIHRAKALELNRVGDGGHGRWFEVREMSLMKPYPDNEDPTTRKVELENLEASVQRIRAEVEGSNEKKVSQKQRRGWAMQLEEIAVLVGRLAVAEEPGFVPEPP